MDKAFLIRRINARDVYEAMQLVWRVFLEFEAPEYAPEGIAAFKAYIDSIAIAQKTEEKKLLLWGCFDHGKIVGVLAMREPCHISLLFVEKAYHKKGIAKKLLQTVIAYYKAKTKHRVMTVNSSPYAVAIYEKMGFVKTDVAQVQNGMRFTPMQCEVE